MTKRAPTPGSDKTCDPTAVSQFEFPFRAGSALSHARAAAESRREAPDSPQIDYVGRPLAPPGRSRPYKGRPTFRLTRGSAAVSSTPIDLLLLTACRILVSCGHCYA
jgi:hypothetical protein